MPTARGARSDDDEPRRQPVVRPRRSRRPTRSVVAPGRVRVAARRATWPMTWRLRQVERDVGTEAQRLRRAASRARGCRGCSRGRGRRGGSRSLRPTRRKTSFASLLVLAVVAAGDAPTATREPVALSEAAQLDAELRRSEAERLLRPVTAAAGGGAAEQREGVDVVDEVAAATESRCTRGEVPSGSSKRPSRSVAEPAPAARRAPAGSARPARVLLDLLAGARVGEERRVVGEKGQMRAELAAGEDGEELRLKCLLTGDRHARDVDLDEVLADGQRDRERQRARQVEARARRGSARSPASSPCRPLARKRSPSGFSCG